MDYIVLVALAGGLAGGLIGLAVVALVGCATLASGADNLNELT